MKFFTLIDSGLKLLLQLLLVAIVVTVCWQIFSRDVLSDPSSFTEELSRYLLIWITLFGCAYAYRQNVHLGLDLIYQQSHGVTRRNLYLIMHLLVVIFALCTMIIGGMSLVLMTYRLGQVSPVMGMDIGALYLAIPISGGLIVFFAMEKIINFKQIVGDTLPVNSNNKNGG